MNQLLNHELFKTAWKDLPQRAQRMMKDFARYPTLGNQSYAIGYLAALFDNSCIRQDTHTYMLSLCGQLPAQGYIVEAIKEAEL